MLSHTYSFVGNTDDDLHCFQAVIRMAWEGLKGEALTLEEGDRLTDFTPGLQTWPFAGILAFADSGAVVRNVENFDPNRFVVNPASEILRQSGGDEEFV